MASTYSQEAVFADAAASLPPLPAPSLAASATASERITNAAAQPGIADLSQLIADIEALSDDEAQNLSPQTRVDVISLLQQAGTSAGGLYPQKEAALRTLTRFPVGEGSPAFPVSLEPRFGAMASTVCNRIQWSVDLNARLAAWSEAYQREERISTINMLKDAFCECYGLRPVPILVKDLLEGSSAEGDSSDESSSSGEAAKPSEMGSYDPIERQVTLDRDFVAHAPAVSVVALLAHELFHAYQDEQAQTAKEAPQNLDLDLRKYAVATEWSEMYQVCVGVQAMPDDDYLSLIHERGARAMERQVTTGLEAVVGRPLGYDSEIDEIKQSPNVSAKRVLGPTLKSGERLGPTEALSSPDGRLRLRIAVNEANQHQLAVTDRFGFSLNWLDVHFGQANSTPMQTSFGLAIGGDNELEITHPQNSTVDYRFEEEELPPGITVAAAHLELRNDGSVQFMIKDLSGSKHQFELT
ncbi:MAG: hypothetical protein AAFU49_18835 [Pseudomonadota bacterium]